MTAHRMVNEKHKTSVITLLHIVQLTTLCPAHLVGGNVMSTAICS